MKRYVARPATTIRASTAITTPTAIVLPDCGGFVVGVDVGISGWDVGTGVGEGVAMGVGVGVGVGVGFWPANTSPPSIVPRSMFSGLKYMKELP